MSQKPVTQRAAAEKVVKDIAGHPEAAFGGREIRIVLAGLRGEDSIAAFVDHYNHHRYHESLGNLTPADVYFGRGQAILDARDQIKKLTIRNRRLSHHGRAA